jgi:acyl-CoA thioesterase
LTKIIDQDRFAEYVGIHLTEVSPGYASANLDEAASFNGREMCRWSIFTLADFTFAAACNAFDILTSAINVKISFLRTSKGDQIRAVASEVSSTTSFVFTT